MTKIHNICHIQDKNHIYPTSVVIPSHMAITSANVWYNILHTYLDYNIYQGNQTLNGITSAKINITISIPVNIIRVYFYLYTNCIG